jgi:hypothetical protein
MEKKISSGLKNLFLVHFILAVVFGLVYLLIPVLYGKMVNWPIEDPPVYRLVGAALIGYGASSWFAFKNPFWAKVELVVLGEIVWCVVGSLVMLWGMFFAGLPVIGWMNTGFLIIFAIGFIHFYIKEKE